MPLLRRGSWERADLCESASVLWQAPWLVFFLGVVSRAEPVVAREGGSSESGLYAFEVTHRFSDRARHELKARYGDATFLDWPQQGTREFHNMLFHLDLHRHPGRIAPRAAASASSKAKAPPLMASSSGNLTYYNLRDGLQYTYIEIGTPSQTYYVTLDTGSDLLWVPYNSMYIEHSAVPLQFAVPVSSFYTGLPRGGCDVSRATEWWRKQECRGYSVRVWIESDRGFSQWLLCTGWASWTGHAQHFDSEHSCKSESDGEFFLHVLRLWIGHGEACAWRQGFSEGEEYAHIYQIFASILLGECELRHCWRCICKDDDAGHFRLRDYVYLPGYHSLRQRHCCCGSDVDQEITYQRVTSPSEAYNRCYSPSNLNTAVLPTIVLSFTGGAKLQALRPYETLADSQGNFLAVCLTLADSKSDYSIIGHNFMVNYSVTFDRVKNKLTWIQVPSTCSNYYRTSFGSKGQVKATWVTISFTILLSFFLILGPIKNTQCVYLCHDLLRN